MHCPSFSIVMSTCEKRAPIAGEIRTLHTAFSHPGRLLGTKPLGVSNAYFSFTTFRVNPNNSVINRFHQLTHRLRNNLSIFKNRLPAKNAAGDFPCQLASDIGRLL